MTPDLNQFNLAGSEALKAVFRNHASGISIVTARDSAGNPIGFTASSVTSLGSNPPLVSFNIAQGSSSYPHLVPGTPVAFHTLDANTLGLAMRLAGDRAQRFDGTEQIGPFDLPLFAECNGILIGKVRQKFEVDSNAVVVVDAISGMVSGASEEPLVYFQRGYHAIGRRLSDNF